MTRNFSEFVRYIGRCIEIRICSFRQWTKTLVALSNSRWTSRRNQNPSPPWNPWRACRPSPWSSRRHPSSPWPRRRRGRSSPWSTRRRSSTATRSIIVTPNHNLKTTNGYPFDVVPRRGELTRGIFHSAPASIHVRYYCVLPICSNISMWKIREWNSRWKTLEKLVAFLSTPSRQHGSIETRFKGNTVSAWQRVFPRVLHVDLGSSQEERATVL